MDKLRVRTGTLNKLKSKHKKSLLSELNKAVKDRDEAEKRIEILTREIYKEVRGGYPHDHSPYILNLLELGIDIS